MKERRKQNQIARDRIVSAMMRLTREKPISEVTVQELTELADVSRMTFYRNYTSKEDVFISNIHDILALYQECDAQQNPEGHFYDKGRIHNSFSYFYQYKSFVNALICCGFSDIFLQNLTEFVLNKWLKDTEDKLERCRIVSFVGILFNSYLDWIQSPQQLTLEELTDLVSSICENAYRNQ